MSEEESLALLPPHPTNADVEDWLRREVDRVTAIRDYGERLRALSWMQIRACLIGYDQEMDR